MSSQFRFFKRSIQMMFLCFLDGGNFCLICIEDIAVLIEYGWIGITIRNKNKNTKILAGDLRI